MKKLFKFLKVLVIITVSFLILLYGGIFLGHKVLFKEPFSNVPTIEAVTDGTMIFGPQAHTQPEALEDFISVLAEQVKRYSEAAPELWPDNVCVNQSVIAEDTKEKKFWLIAPDGTVTSLTKNDAMNYDFNRNAYADGFSDFDGGMYLALSKNDLKNYLKWQKYLHLGTYDVFITFAHEGFHKMQGEKWARRDDIPNAAREEFMENTPARAKRALLQKQLLAAIKNPNDTSLILDALATYADWKGQFPDDYDNSVHWDREEGTAYYYELISSLYAGYPEQIKGKDDLDKAFALLATREDIYVDHGLVAEGYNVGGFTCVLLDRLENDWKERLVNDPDATPIEMLYQHFKNEPLPAPIQLTQAEIDAVGEEIQDKKGSPAGIFRFLYDMLF